MNLNPFKRASKKDVPAPEAVKAAAVIPPRGQFQLTGATIQWVPDNFQSYIVNGYQANDIIYAIVNLIMDKIRVAPWGLYSIEDEGELKKYNSYLQQKQWKLAKEARAKALVTLDKPDAQSQKLLDLLKYPNATETWQDHIANGCGYKLITGNKFIWADLLSAGANEGLPQELIIAPSQHMAIRANNGWPQRIVGYQMQIPVFRIFSTQEIMHEKLWNPDSNAAGAGLYGQSPIKAATKTLTRNTATKRAGAVQLQNSGPGGIIYIDDALVPGEGRTQQAQVIQDGLRKNYSGEDNKGKVPVSGYKLGYTQVGTALKDLNLTDIEEIDLRTLCNIWGVPSQLLNDVANSTYNNVTAAEKALTTRCALPYLTSARDNYNRKFQTDWGFKDKNVYIDFDMSVYAELQEDQAAKWNWVKGIPASANYKMAMMGLDPEKAEGMDVVMIDGTLMPLTDVISGMTDTQVNNLSNELDKAGLFDYLRVAK